MKVETISRSLGRSKPVAAETSHRDRCYGCFRPASECYCDAIPEVENLTELLILQHIRERDHAFNTARMVRQGLVRSRLICGSIETFNSQVLPLHAETGLLFPSKDAPVLSSLPPEQRPRQLILLDGTWSHAKNMVRDIAQLRSVPHFKLAPTKPGQYRIRLEPTDTSLSTVEAAVQALRAVEPETQGIEKLLDAFHQMVDRQLNHPRVGRAHYSGGPKSGTTLNIPRQLNADPKRIVVAYGEPAYRSFNKSGFAKVDDCGLSARPPLVWVARRLGDGDEYRKFLDPDVELTDSFLQHLELDRGCFSESISTSRFRQDWNRWLRKDDILVVYNPGTIQLLENVQAETGNCLVLKSINYQPKCKIDSTKRKRTLSEFVVDNRLDRSEPDPAWGRAAKRLENAIALVKYLRNLSHSQEND